MASKWNDVWRDALEAGVNSARSGGTEAASLVRTSAAAFERQVATATEALVSGDIDQETFDYEIEGCKAELRTAIAHTRILAKATVQKAVNAIFDSLLQAVTAGIRF